MTGCCTNEDGEEQLALLFFYVLIFFHFNFQEKGRVAGKRNALNWVYRSVNPAFDAEVDAARAILDEGQRITHYRRAFQILREEVPGVGLFQDYAIYLARKELKWTPTANEAFFVSDMKWQP